MSVGVPRAFGVMDSRESGHRHERELRA
jgi:hypothetical protein